MKSALLASVLTASLSLALGLAGAANAQTTQSSQARPVVIGYLAAFKDMKGPLEATNLDHLTHINVSFLNPDKNGVFVRDDAFPCMDGPGGVMRTGDDLRHVVNTAHAKGVKVLVSVAGGILPACSGDWVELLSDRDGAVAKLMQVIDTYNLDGLDIDLEWDVLTAVDKAGLYTPFIAAASVELRKRGKLLTVATASNPGGMIPKESIPYFDYINLMSYDGVGETWGQPGEEHSSYRMAVKDIETWEALGARRSQIVLGVPWYGRGFGEKAGGGWSYKRIVEVYGPDAAYVDIQGQLCAKPDGTWCDVITYNGIPTMKAKMELAKERTAGVMIWELSQDKPGPLNLLRIMHETLNK